MSDTLIIHRADLDVAFPAHVSHMLQVSYNTECHNCWGCSCHSPDILTQPCQYTVGAENHYPVRVIEAISRQATRYGEQIRLLEDAGLEGDRSKVRKAYEVFLKQLTGLSHLREISRSAYYDAYCQ